MKFKLGLVSLAALAAIGCGKEKTAADKAEGYGVDRTAEATDSATAQSEAREFVDKVAMANKVEVQTSEMAATRSQRADVKALAAMIVADHKAAGEKLVTAAGSVTPPTTLDAAHQAKIDDITNSDADSFDRDYLDLQEEAHEQAVALFEDYRENGDVETLRNFATEVLPTLRAHLVEVREIREGFDVGDDAMGLGSGESDPDTDDTNPDSDNDPSTPQ